MTVFILLLKRKQMTKNISTTSIEEQVEDWCKKQLDGVKYYTKTESINYEIENALKKAPSKKGGSGINYPDIKCFIESGTMRRIPVMIEVKGRKGKFVKLTDKGEIANKKSDNTPNYKNIAEYAVNGAVHYAMAILNLHRKLQGGNSRRRERIRHRDRPRT